MRRLPLPASLVALALLVGCASPARKVASSQNSYDFYIDRFNTACHVAQPPAPCAQKVVLLNQYEHDLHLAAKALANGGAFPLQLKAIKDDEKAAAK